MDWLDKMNSALDYIEDNLDGEINMNTVAQKACCSSYNFQRLFSFITDVTLAEYIRRRRLTLAAAELQGSASKVIELALKYGYDSPVSFTRAFQALHGVTPNEARRSGSKLKAYPKISFHISIKGDREMDYRIEERIAFRVVGIKKRCTLNQEENLISLPKFWDELWKNGKVDEILGLSDQIPRALFGVCADANDTEFDYYIASASGKPLPEGFDELTVPAATWAIFDCTGPMPDAIQAVMKRIFTEWLPTSGYVHAEGPELEWYSDADMDSEDYKSEVWIPVVKTKK
jgi:AraC family transcriptional regulator